MTAAPIIWLTLGLACCLLFGDNVYANVHSKVRCLERTMEVDIFRTSPKALIYLQQLKNYPDEACKPKLNNGIATFKLSLVEKKMSRCGVSRITNKLTGQKIYYHRIIVEEPNNTSKLTFTVKCSITEAAAAVTPKFTSNNANNNNSNINNYKSLRNHTNVRRSVLPEDFEADTNTQISDTIIGNTSVPTLLFNVRQGHKIIKDELVVSPGTPLQMEIYLSEEPAQVYGLLVTHMQVTDTKTQEETIIYNGCSVDPYLFENFNTVDGDFLSAKFRAFKFPESSYVQFRGTVTVCVDKCRGIECSNGQIGYGRRRRRSVDTRTSNKNEIYEMAMSMFIRVDYDPNSEIDGGKKRAFERTVRAEEVREQFKYLTGPVESSATIFTAHVASVILTIFFNFWQHF